MKNWHFYFKKTRHKTMFGMSIILCIITMLLGCHFYINAILPEKIYITANEEQSITVPIPGKFSCDSSVVSSKMVDGMYTIYSDEVGEYALSFQLFGMWNYKNVVLEVMEDTEVIPGGMPVGIYIKSDGIFVIETATLRNEKGEQSSPCKGLLHVGDYILEINGKQIKEKEEISEIVEASQGTNLILKVKREEKLIEVEVTPFLDESGKYKLGLWVRDDTQGIGTVTYIESDGSFGALGHGISDADVGIVMDCAEGTLYEAQIRGIIKGVSGTPGSLSGIICYGTSSDIGEIIANTEQGVFGRVNDRLIEQLQLEPVEIAYKQEVQVGPATIWCTVDGEMKEYDILIKEVNAYSLNSNKGMVIEIVDKELIEKTGGIVQGMSGSPIIQNGRLVGAVTHVLVNDPTRGYGIFIENMLDVVK